MNEKGVLVKNGCQKGHEERKAMCEEKMREKATYKKCDFCTLK